MNNSIKEKYLLKKKEISSKLDTFKSISDSDIFSEFIFCLLTPGSNAQRCWSAVEELRSKSPNTLSEIALILRGKSRFHNNKAKRVFEAQNRWKEIKSKLNNSNRLELRNWLAENVNGYGLKESSHFLRNIGKSDNQLAILDRHILKHLAISQVIPKTDKLKSKNHYLEIEQKFIDFSNKVGIPIDHIDLLWWSEENGEIFK